MELSAQNGKVTVQVIQNILCDRIRPLPGQPREYFDTIELENLANSIREIGQRVPAQVVVIHGDPRHDYELIDGQRRWHAVQLAGKKYLRCEVLDDVDEDWRYVLSSVANMARVGLHPLETAVMCDRLRRINHPETNKQMTVSQVASMIGRSVSYVDQHISLLQLVPSLQKLLHPRTSRDKRLPFSAAILLARLDPRQQMEAFEKIKVQKIGLLKATQRVVEDMPTSKKTKRKSYIDRYIYLKRLLHRIADELEFYQNQQFQHQVCGRDQRDLNVLRQDLERIHVRVTWMLKELPEYS